MTDAEEWLTYADERSVDRGTVGNVAWFLTPTGMPVGLNGYLALPEGHPWLDEEAEDRFGDPPYSVSFQLENIVGVSGADGVASWDEAELRTVVEPWPDGWDSWLTSLAEMRGRFGEEPFSRAFGVSSWTVAEWRQEIVAWAARAFAAYPDSAARAVDDEERD